MAGTMDWLNGGGSSGGGLFGSHSAGEDLGFAGGAVKDIFGGIGSLQEAKGYEKAAKIEESNAQLAGASEQLQLFQTQRQFERAQGATQAGLAGAGLAASGSALDVLRMGAEQGALQKQIVSTQGQIQIQNFEQQAEADKALASAAKAGAAGGFLGGALDIAKMFI